MTQAKITKKDGYRCSPNGFTIETFAFGQIVEGRVAQWALDDRAAQRLFDPREETKVQEISETKAKPKKPKLVGTGVRKGFSK